MKIVNEEGNGQENEKKNQIKKLFPFSFHIINYNFYRLYSNYIITKTNEDVKVLLKTKPRREVLILWKNIYLRKYGKNN